MLNFYCRFQLKRSKPNSAHTARCACAQHEATPNVYQYEDELFSRFVNCYHARCFDLDDNEKFNRFVDPARGTVDRRPQRRGDGAVDTEGYVECQPRRTAKAKRPLTAPPNVSKTIMINLCRKFFNDLKQIWGQVGKICFRKQWTSSVVHMSMSTSQCKVLNYYKPFESYSCI